MHSFSFFMCVCVGGGGDEGWGVCECTLNKFSSNRVWTAMKRYTMSHML